MILYSLFFLTSKRKKGGDDVTLLPVMMPAIMISQWTDQIKQIINIAFSDKRNMMSKKSRHNPSVY